MKQVRTEWSRWYCRNKTIIFYDSFFFYLQILKKYIQRYDTAMLCIDEFYQKISKKHCNGFLRDL